MKRLALAAAMFSVAAICPVYAGAPSPPCCACFIPDHDSAVVALFCVSPTNTEEQTAAIESCKATDGAELFCEGGGGLQSGETTSQYVSPSCVQELRANDIICPRVDAPALDEKALGALAGLLALLGAWALRRRARLG